MSWVFAFLIPVAVAFGGGEKQGMKTLDLNGAFLRAVEVSEELKVMDEEIRVAEAQFWQSVSRMLPQVTLSNDYSYDQRVRTRTAGGFGLSGGSRDRTVFTVGVRQLLFNGFQDYFLAGASKEAAGAKGLEQKRERELLYLRVSELFYQILSFQDDVEILQELRGSLEKRVAELDERVKIGRSRRSEFLAARSELAGTLVVIEQTKGVLNSSRELMAFLVKLPADRYQLRDERPFPKPEALTKYLWSTGERADVLASLRRSVGARKEGRAAAAGFVPRVEVEGRYDLIQEPNSSNDWNIVLHAELPVFEGGLKFARIAEAGARVRQAELSFSRIRRLADNEVRTAYAAFTSMAAQWVRLQEAEEIAKESYDLQRKDYDLGRSSNLDVLNALTRLRQAARERSATGWLGKSNLIALEVAAGRAEP